MYSSEFFSDNFLHLNSCGIETVNIDKKQLRKKGRIDWHILYIYGGRCHAVKNNRKIIVNEGSLIVFRPGERQEYSFFAKDKTILCWLHFTGGECERLIDKLFLSESDTVYIGKSFTLKSILEKMVLEYTHKKMNYEEICNALLWEFFAAAARKSFYCRTRYSTDKIHMINSVPALMHERFAENLPLMFYAEHCNLSLSRFAHLFSEIVGISPSAYLTRIKLDKAEELLSSTDIPIGEIAEKVGFSDRNYFSATFKKHFGVSPNKYRTENT